MIGIVRTGEAVDRDAGNALQRLGHRTIGQGADIFRGDRVDNGVGVALDILGIGERLADTADDDDIFIGLADGHRIGILIVRIGILGECRRAAHHASDNERGCACPENALQQISLHGIMPVISGHMTSPPMLALPHLDGQLDFPRR